MSAARRGRRPLVIAGSVVIAAALVYLFYGGIESSLVYFRTPTELAEMGDAAYGAPVRLGGQVVAGSVQWDAQALDLRFRMTDGQTEIAVHSKGAPPQMFRDGIGVIVEGRYTEAGVFEATNVMVKHSNEYRAPPPGEHPAEYYRELFGKQSPDS
ncbi:MAG TPA: cytochrome c maturation protein CcmE [Longimicrobiales bacterium]